MISTCAYIISACTFSDSHYVQKPSFPSVTRLFVLLIRKSNAGLNTYLKYSFAFIMRYNNAFDMPFHRTNFPDFKPFITSNNVLLHLVDEK